MHSPPYACFVRVLAPVFHAVINVFPAGIGQKHRPVIGFAGFHGIEALYLCFSVFEQRGGDFRGERFPAFLAGAFCLGVADGQVVGMDIADALRQKNFHPIAICADHLHLRSVRKLGERGLIKPRAGADIQLFISSSSTMESLSKKFSFSLR